MKLPALFAIINLFFASYTYSCSCSVTQTFFEKIDTSHIIFSAKVIDHIDIPSDSYLLTNPNNKSITRLEVIEYFQNDIDRDTIFYINGNSSSCGSSIRSMDINTELVIKSKRAEMMDNLRFFIEIGDINNKFDSTLLDYLVVEYHICDISIFNIEEAYIEGSITKNLNRRKYQALKLIYRIHNDFGEKLTNLGVVKLKFQRMKLSKFGKLVAKNYSKMIE